MLLIDDLILAPGRFVLWIANQVNEAVGQELDQEGERLTAELCELHRRLESGALNEEEFDARESELLDRLDELEARAADSSEADSGGGES